MTTSASVDRRVKTYQSDLSLEKKTYAGPSFWASSLSLTFSISIEETIEERLPSWT